MAVKNRAETNEQKREVIEQLYQLWTTGDNKYLRLGQLIVNAVGSDPFYTEDFDLIQKIKEQYESSSN